MFWGFFISLLIVSIIAPFALALVSTPSMLLAWGYSLIAQKYAVEDEYGEIAEFNMPSSVRVVTYPLLALIFAINIYIYAGWAAFVATKVNVTVVKVILQAGAVGETSPPRLWHYYVIGGILLYTPLSWMKYKERMAGGGQSLGDRLFPIITLAAYVLFCLKPTLVVPPYGWFFNWWYS